ncbi:RluA family pseudouridine synthase [Rubripirellula amarantea]|nr:RluA family pseudouridine synthase [Rubripirellula amarantea]
MTNPNLDVIFEDNHLLVVNKPTGIATMGADDGPTLHSIAVEYVRKKYNKPGRVFLGIVSRLDTVTSGVLVLPRTSKSASRLTPQFQPTAKGSGKSAVKVYLAVVSGYLDQPSGTFTDFVAKDDRAKRMRIVGPGHPEASEAKLAYQVIAEHENGSIVAVRLLTGRKHQIRVQFADRGYPILGDQKYGSAVAFPSGIALHSWKLQIEHPTLKIPMEFGSKVPSSWNMFADFVKDPEVWDTVKRRFSIESVTK